MGDSQYPWTRWPVNDEPLNTFVTLELLFPISKKEFVLVLFQFPNTIVYNFLLPTKMDHLHMILFCSNMNRLFMVLPKNKSSLVLLRLVRHASLCFVYIQHITLPSESLNGILFMKHHFKIKITNNLQHV